MEDKRRVGDVELPDGGLVLYDQQAGRVLVLKRCRNMIATELRFRAVQKLQSKLNDHLC
jgi:hypothetical protein